MDAIAEKTAAAGVTIDGLLLKDGKMRQRHLTLDEIQRSAISGPSTVSATAEDMAGASITFTPAVASTALIFVSGDLENSSASTATITLQYDGVDLNPPATLGMRRTMAPPVYSGFNWIAWKTGITAASHTIKLQWKTSAGTLYCNRGELIVILFAS